MTMRFLLCALLAWGFSGTAHAAGWSIPAGSSLQVQNGAIDLAGGTMQVAGALSLGAGQVRAAGDFSIASGGVVTVASGLIQVRENWSNLGGFGAGAGSVNFVDGIALVNTILGSTQFHNLSLITSRGETYLFQAGSEQRVAGALQIQGNGQPIRFASTSSGSSARINLLTGGTQAITNVGVNGVVATGQPLAPTGSNQSPGGLSTGWFGAGSGASAPAVIPSTDAWALLLLGLLIALAAMTLLRPHLLFRQD